MGFFDGVGGVELTGSQGEGLQERGRRGGVGGGCFPAGLDLAGDPIIGVVEADGLVELVGASLFLIGSSPLAPCH